MDPSFRRYIEILPERISVRHKVSSRTEKSNFHLHEQAEIVFTISDNLQVRFEDSVVPIPRHALLLLDSLNLHYIFSEEGSGICDRHVLYFSPDFISFHSSPELNLMECFLIRKDEKCVMLQVPENRIPTVETLFTQMETVVKELGLITEEAAGDRSLFMGQKSLQFLLGLLLIEINQLYDLQLGIRHSPLYREHAEVVGQISEYIRSHYYKSLDADLLSHMFSISKTKLYALFREIYGVTINEYVTDCRIANAKNMLINSNYSVEIISDKTGYGSISSFSRLFKAKTGKSPLQYRKANS